MIGSKERLRLESAYAAPLDAAPTLVRCAAGLLVVLALGCVSAAPAGDGHGAVARFSAPPAASGR